MIDACVAGAWSFTEPYSPQAQFVLNAITAHRVNSLAPERFTEETLRICQKKTLPPPDGASIAPDDAWTRFLDVVTSPIYFVPSDELLERAWQLALAARVTTHDALYLAAAELWGAALWTLDRTIAGLSPAAFPCVRDLRFVAFPY